MSNLGLCIDLYHKKYENIISPKFSHLVFTLFCPVWDFWENLSQFIPIQAQKTRSPVSLPMDTKCHACNFA